MAFVDLSGRLGSWASVLIVLVACPPAKGGSETETGSPGTTGGSETSAATTGDQATSTAVTSTTVTSTGTSTAVTSTSGTDTSGTDTTDTGSVEADCDAGYALKWCIENPYDYGYSDMAIGPGQEIVVVGDDGIEIFDAEGALLWEGGPPFPARSVAFRDATSFYVAGARIEPNGDVGLARPMLRRFGLDGELLGHWEAAEAEFSASNEYVARHPEGGAVVAGYRGDSELWIGRFDDALTEVSSLNLGWQGGLRGMVVDADGRVIVALVIGDGNIETTQMYAYQSDGMTLAWYRDDDGMVVRGIALDASGHGVFMYGDDAAGGWRATKDSATGNWLGQKKTWPSDHPDLNLVEPLGDPATAFVIGGSDFTPYLARYTEAGDQVWTVDLPAEDLWLGGVTAMGRTPADCTIVAAGFHRPSKEESSNRSWVCKFSP